jgi:hypothetical protein
METHSDGLVEVHAVAAEEVTRGTGGDHAALVGDDDDPCKELVLVAVKEQEAVLTELESVLPVMEGDHMEIEMSHSLHAPGDGDGDGEAPVADENGTPVSASQEEIAEFTCKEVMTPGQEGCKTASLPEFLPVPEDNEPAWGDVPDEIPVEPIAPPRPPKRPRVAPECVEVDDIVQTMRNILFNL